MKANQLRFRGGLVDVFGHGWSVQRSVGMGGHYVVSNGVGSDVCSVDDLVRVLEWHGFELDSDGCCHPERLLTALSLDRCYFDVGSSSAVLFK